MSSSPLQKTRCPYFRASEPTPCNRRLRGSGCAALHGLNDNHAIFGWTEACGSGRALADIVSGRMPEVDYRFVGVERRPSATVRGGAPGFADRR